MYIVVAIVIVIAVIAMIICWWLAGVYNIRNPPPLEPRYDFGYLERQFSSIPTNLWFRNDPKIFDRYLGCKCEEYTVIDSSMSVIYNNKMSPKTKECDTSTCLTEPCYYRSCLPVDRIPFTFEVTSAVVTGVGRGLRVISEPLDGCVASCGRCQVLAVRVRDGDIVRVVHISKNVIAPCDVAF